MDKAYEETDVKVVEEVESFYTFVDVSSPKKKRKSRGSTEHAEKNKKPRSAYLLYYFDVHQNLQQENPDMPQSEINKRISDSWRRLSVADKAYYLDRAKREKDGLKPTSQFTSPHDVPGFRKILPRTDYELLPKTSPVEKTSGAFIEVCVEDEVEALKQDVSEEPMVSPLIVGSEVELMEQCVTAENVVLDSGRRILILPQQAQPHTPCVVKEDGGGTQSGGHNVVIEQGPEGGTLVSQIKLDTAQVVTIIPNNELVENRVIPTFSPIMMRPLIKQLKPHPKPSVKLPIKYSRRGRGSCSTPGCSFMYVTRHKPPLCPKCGQHLGGKWVPPAGKEAGSSARSSPRKTKGQLDVSGSAAVSSKMADQNRDDGRQGGEAMQHKVQEKSPALSGPVSKAGPQNNEKTLVVLGQLPSDGALMKGSVGSSAIIGLNGGCVQVISKDQTGQKRRIRAILPAPVTQSIPYHTAVIQLVAVPSNQLETDNKCTTRPVKVTGERILGLKPSTLKQLGHPVQHSALQQNLGLSTLRGKGRCKNPCCDYIYKNRHKPPYCPNCGCELSTKTAKKAKISLPTEQNTSSIEFLDASQTLTSSQRELRRQSTVTLLKHGLQYPENEAELQDVLNLIHDLNHNHRTMTEETEMDKHHNEDVQPSAQSAWPSFYEPEVSHCKLCQSPLYNEEESCLGGQQLCWLLTQTQLQPVTLQVKVCLNTQCLAVHSFTGLHPGLFNVGNQLLASLDLFFIIRNQIKQGDDPALAAHQIINNTHRPPDCTLSETEQTQLQELLCCGYWAFECLTVRDYNDMICGLCGIAPKLEIAQRSTDCVLHLKNVEFIWPEFQAPDEIQVDEFWMAMESEALEQCAFPSTVSITRFDASIIAPFFPSLMRNTSIINTEKDKISLNVPPSVDLSRLVRLIHDAQLKPEQMHQHTEEELQSVLEQCGFPSTPEATKEELIASINVLYTHVRNGLTTAPQPPQHLTAGKLSKVCPHQVVCGSKYLVREENARDHVDLLVSSYCWPSVYIADCAQKVALCAESLYPELASQMWGRNQGCLPETTGTPEMVSCPELDLQCDMNFPSVESNPHVHPHTKSSTRYILHPGTSSSSSAEPHRSMTLCKELQSYSDLVSAVSSDSEVRESKPGDEENPKQLVFDNPAHYYLYNRLTDFLKSRDVVSLQMAEVLKECQQGDMVMIRDALYRFGVAQLNREEGYRDDEIVVVERE